MAQTFLKAAMGAAANDGSGSKIRVGGLAIATDLAELYSRVAALESSIVTADAIVRASIAVATGDPDQVIDFSNQFVPDYVLTIIDNEGLGIEVTAQDADGFTITPGAAGNFSYVAVIEV